MNNPKTVILEADCHSHDDALKLQSILTDLIMNNDLAGEHVDQALIRYVSKDDLTQREIHTDDFDHQVELEARRVDEKYNQHTGLIA